jgi:hypothetical protein
MYQMITCVSCPLSVLFELDMLSDNSGFDLNREFAFISTGMKPTFWFGR